MITPRHLGVGCVDLLRANVQRVVSAFDRTPPDAFLEPPADAARECRNLPVVILPGVLENWRFEIDLQRSLHRCGHPVHVLPELGWNVDPLDRCVQVVLDYLEQRDVRGVVLVAHSKGGLIGKAVLLDPEGARRALGMVVTNAPFNGSSWMPRWADVPVLGLFRPGSPELTRLADCPEPNARIVSLAPEFDQVVPRGSFLPGARNLCIDVWGHFAPLVDPGVHALIHAQVHELAAGPTGRDDEWS